MTNANFYSMVEIVFLFSQDYTLRDESGLTVGRNHHPLQPGKYFILTAGSITVTNEPWLVRAASPPTAIQSGDFCQAIRERDRRCIMTGKGARSAAVGFWAGLEAAHFLFFFRQRTNATGLSITMVAVSLSNQSREDLSTRFRTEYCLRPLFTSFLKATSSLSTRMCVFLVLPLEFLLANNASGQLQDRLLYAR